ncbi:MAG: NADH-quinone oxidoreductase subunit J [Actinomycetota bacterium]|nr:NADH-quinone oxidoreductase subunit J [Actinomycetota bacterium]MDA8280492.1 NADH-quinone oxidoreductase subunit J [Actinomycetota bacterium]
MSTVVAALASIGPLAHLAGAGLLGVVSRVDFVTFWACAVIVVVGAVGVVVSRNPVHAALMLVMTLFAVAVLFIEQHANFLAAVQVIVYAGAIVVLFLFVIMFLGVDRDEDVNHEPLRGQRILAPVLVVLGLAGVLVLGIGAHWAVGAPSVVGPARGQPGGDVAALGRAVFTVYLFPFEITAGLLVIAVVGAVVLARRPPATGQDELPAGVPGDQVAGSGGEPAAGLAGAGTLAGAGEHSSDATGHPGPAGDVGASPELAGSSEPQPEPQPEPHEVAP